MHCTDPPSFEAGRRFLTLLAEPTRATMTDTSCIHNPQRPIAFWSVLLWIEWMIGGATQRPIGLWEKS
jgi:hypothetical protein